MKCRWHGRPYHDISIRKWLITFETEEAPDVFDTTRDKDLTLEVKPYKEKRSLDANAYFHVIVDKMAKALNISAIEAKNMMLSRYGYIDKELPPIIIPDEIEWQKVEQLHLRPTASTRVLDNGKLYRVYYVIRGSHTYDTEEMGHLIDGTIEEAKVLGIETDTPEQIERMKSLWKAY